MKEDDYNPTEDTDARLDAARQEKVDINITFEIFVAEYIEGTKIGLKENVLAIRNVIN